MTRQEYSTDFGGGRPVAMRFAIVGRMDVAGFLAFVAERAGWLDLSGWVAPAEDGVMLLAAGPEALVGALEMACTLGPLDAVIERVDTVEVTMAVGPGFEVRR